jgi:hypothetical protein
VATSLPFTDNTGASAIRIILVGRQNEIVPPVPCEIELWFGRVEPFMHPAVRTKKETIDIFLNI